MKCQRVLTVAIAAVLIGSGCNGDDDDDHGDHEQAGNGHVDSGVLPDEEEVRCPDDIPEFFAGETVGVEAAGDSGLVMARVIEADHVPLKRFSNTWKIALTSADDGSPLTDATIVKACAFMPVHRHGLPPREINALEEPGRFELKALNFTMRGPWEVQLAVGLGSVAKAADRATDCDPGKIGSDYLAFRVCVMDE